MKLPARFTGYALAAAGAALFSTKAIFIKLAFADRVDAALMLAWRMIFSLPFYLAIGAWAWSKRRAQGAPPPDTRTIGFAAVTGFVGYYMASAFDFAGLQYISAQLERLVLFTYPMFVMLIGAALGEHKITASGLAAAAITYTGIAVVFAADLSSSGQATVTGTLLVLGAAIAFACHQVMAKRVLPALGSALFTAIALSTASVFCILHQAIVSGGNFEAPARFLWLAAGCAVFATVMPTLMINAGIARTSPQSVAMISNISPLVTIALAVAMLGEEFGPTDAAGAALVLAGIGLYTWGEGRARQTAGMPGDEQDVFEAAGGGTDRR